MKFSLLKGIFVLLMFILSIEGTIALRNILMVLIIGLLFYDFKILRDSMSFILKAEKLRNITMIYLIFVLYILWHSIFISHDPTWSIDEWRAHIVYPLIYFLVGISIANYSIVKKIVSKESLITAVFFTLLVHIAFIDLIALREFINNGAIIRRFGGFMHSPTLANYITNIVLATLTSEYIYRLRTKQRFLLISNGFLHFALLLSIFSTFFESLRLGDISLVLLSLSASFIFIYKNNKYVMKLKILIVFLLVTILTIPLAYNLSTDKRWVNLIETIPIALDTHSSRHWVNRNIPPPETASGLKVQGSNYERIAWAKKSIELIADEPIGIGFGRSAFGHALQMSIPEDKENINPGKTSHSSILDLTIGIGIPGLLLWCIFIFYISYVSFQFFSKKESFFSMLTLFISIGYFSRGIVDANLRDHMILQFMLILGLCLYFLFKEEEIEKDNICKG